MYISLSDLALFILFIIIVTSSAFLIVVLYRMLGVLGQVREILNAHNSDIRETLATLPLALANINELAIRLKKTTEQASDAVGFLQDDFTETVDGLRTGLETFVVYARIIGEVFRAVFSK